MPSLRETQQAMRHDLLQGEECAASLQVIHAGIAPRQRLSVYRNTMLGTLSKALGLSFPAVRRLVGGDFFDETSRRFVREQPPSGADLNGYGSTFAEFLRRFEAASTLAYLPDVASLEWAVNRALHAADESPIEMAALAAVDPGDQHRVCFVVHPSISLMGSPYPVDKIWQAVLEHDDAAMAAIDLAEGPVSLLIERVDERVTVTRLDGEAWRFADALFRGDPLGSALDSAGMLDAPTAIARHLLAGRCIAFRLAAEPA